MRGRGYVAVGARDASAAPRVVATVATAVDADDDDAGSAEEDALGVVLSRIAIVVVVVATGDRRVFL